MLLECLEQFCADGAALPAQRIVHPDPVAADINPATALEVGQVARYCGLRQLENFHKVADAQLTFSLQEQDDAQSDRVGEGF